MRWPRRAGIEGWDWPFGPHEAELRSQKGPRYSSKCSWLGVALYSISPTKILEAQARRLDRAHAKTPTRAIVYILRRRLSLPPARVSGVVQSVYHESLPILHSRRKGTRPILQISPYRPIATESCTAVHLMAVNGVASAELVITGHPPFRWTAYLHYISCSHWHSDWDVWRYYVFCGFGHVI